MKCFDIGKTKLSINPRTMDSYDPVQHKMVKCVHKGFIIMVGECEPGEELPKGVEWAFRHTDPITGYSIGVVVVKDLEVLEEVEVK